MPSRSFKCETNYKKIKKARKRTTGCVFCDFKNSSHKDEIIKEYEHFWLVKNIFAYDMWDDQGVTDHLMLVPKRHIESLGELDETELLQYSTIIGQYDKNGYSIYARSFKNAIKSIPHQHTHLMKLDGKMTSFLFFNKKPYILFKK